MAFDFDDDGKPVGGFDFNEDGTPWGVLDTTKEVAKQVGVSLGARVPQSILQAARGIVNATGDDLDGSLTKSLTKAIEWYDDPILAVQHGGAGEVGRTMIDAASQVGPSIVGMAASAVNPYLGGAYIMSAFGGQQFDDTYNKAIASGVSRDDALKAGGFNALIEGGGELVGDMLGLKLLKGAGDIVSGGVKSALSNVTDTRVMVPFLRDTLLNAGLQSSTEFAQGAGEAAVEKAYNIRDANGNLPDWYEQGSEGFRVGMGISALLSPFGLGARIAVRNQNAKVLAALHDKDAPVEDRMSAAKLVYDTLKEEGQDDAATAWSQGAALSIAAGQGIQIERKSASIEDIFAANDSVEAIAAAEQYVDEGSTSRLAPTIDEFRGDIAPPALPNYAGQPLVVKPDGSTMTGVEAERERLAAMKVQIDTSGNPELAARANAIAAVRGDTVRSDETPAPLPIETFEGTGGSNELRAERGGSLLVTPDVAPARANTVSDALTILRTPESGRVPGDKIKLRNVAERIGAENMAALTQYVNGRALMTRDARIAVEKMIASDARIAPAAVLTPTTLEPSVATQRVEDNERGQYSEGRMFAGSTLRSTNDNDLPGERVSRGMRKFLTQMGRLTGTSITFEYAPGNADGVLPDRTRNAVHINTAATINPMAVLGHEVTHVMKEKHRDAWNAVRDSLVSSFGTNKRDALLAFAKDYWHSRPDRVEAVAEIDDLSADLTPEQRDLFNTDERSIEDMLVNEMVSDLGGNHWTREEFWQDVFARIEEKHGSAKAKGVIARLVDNIKDLLAKFMKLARGGRYESINEAQIKASHDAIVAAYAEFINSERTTPEAVQKVNEPSAAPEAVQEGDEVDAARRQEADTLALSQESTARRRLFFEAAPDPRDEAAKQQWEATPEASRARINDKLRERIVPGLLRDLGAKGEVVEQLGGWMDETNPSYALIVESGDVNKVARALGYVLDQQAVYVMSADEFDNANESGIVMLNVAGMSPSATHDLYAAIRALDTEAISGHSTVDGEMYIGLDPDVMSRLQPQIAEISKQHGAAGVIFDKGYSATIEDKDYGFQRGIQTSAGLRTEAGRVGYWKTEVRKLRSDAASGVSLGGGTAREVTQRGRRLAAEGIHFSREQREFLSSSFFGTGLKGAEWERLRNASDPRLTHRIYFYINAGTGIHPEAGVGGYAHRADLDGLYDMDADPLDLHLGRDGNAMESAILDAGFDGYMTRTRGGVAVMLGPRNMRVSPADTTSVAEAPRDTPSDYRIQIGKIVADKSLPAGQLRGAEWKKRLPEMDLSHLDDTRDYYKDQLVRRPQMSESRREAWWFSPLARQAAAVPMKSGDATAWKNWLKSLTSKGVKQDEIRWSGIEEWLDGKIGKITKEEVQTYLDNFGVKLETVVRGDPDYDGKRVEDDDAVVGMDVDFGRWETEDPDYDWLLSNAEARLDDEINELIENARTDDISREEAEAALYFDNVDEDDIEGETDEERFNSAKTQYRERLLEKLVEREEQWYWEDSESPAYRRVTMTVGDNDYAFLHSTSYGEHYVRANFGNYDDVELPRSYRLDDADITGAIQQYLLENTDAFESVDTEGPLAPKWENYRTDAGRSESGSYREVLLTLPEGSLRDSSDYHYTTHFPEANIIGFFRMDEHRDDDGKRIMVVQEVQSDWGQHWHKASRAKEKLADLEAKQADARRRAIDASAALREALPGMSATELDMLSRGVVPLAAEYANQLKNDELTVAKEAFAARAAAEREYNTARNEASDNVPDGPLIGATTSWAGLLMKKIIAHAVEHNFDKVVWTTGAQQVERWRSALRQNVDKIEWDKSEQGIHIVAYRSGREMANTRYKETDLTVALGKTMGDRIITDPSQSGTIEGDDITLSDIGMGVFYERILPNVANDILKKLDKSVRVGEVSVRAVPEYAKYSRINTLNEPVVTVVQLRPREENRTVGNYYTDEEADAAIEAKKREYETVTATLRIEKQLGFPITPAIRESVANGLPLFSERRNVKDDARNNWYRSQLSDALASVPAKLKTGNDVSVWLQANAGRLGVTKDELKWSGVIEWLKGYGRAPVTPSDFNGGVRVQEVMLSNVFDRPMREELERLSDIPRGDRTDEQRARIRELQDAADNEGSPSSAKFAAYQTPGGSNYRELLLTLPERRSVEDEERLAYLEKEGYGDASDPHIGDDIKAEVARLRKMPVAFKSPHFDQPNILAHVRFNERTDAEGRRVLFLEEVQSDWAQKGRKEGFGEQDTGETITPPMTPFAPQQAVRVVKQGVPSAPFVTDTKSWTALALKRMVTYAVDNGFDAIAWTTGEQQAERYDLSKQVGSIYHSANEDGTYAVTVLSINGDVLWEDFKATSSLIEDHIGKEITQKIINGEGREDSGSKELTGLDLKVGGEGMRGYYDAIVPQAMRDVLKKAGGGKVDAIAFDALGQQPGVVITPELRAAVARKLPLFSERRKYAFDDSLQSRDVHLVKHKLFGREGETDIWLTSIVDPATGEAVGAATIGMRKGLPNAIYHVESDGNGWGEKFVRAMAATSADDIYVQNTVPKAVEFWRKMGINWFEHEEHGDGAITFESYTKSRPAQVAESDARARDAGNEATGGKAARYSPLRKNTENLDTALKRMDKFVTAFERGELKPEYTQAIGPTPTVLQMLGAKPLTMEISGEAVQKILAVKHRYHVTPEMLRQLPADLYDPLMVFEDAQGGFVVLTEMGSPITNEPVVAAVHVNWRSGGRYLINKIASMYEVENARNRDKLAVERLKYVRDLNDPALATIRRSLSPAKMVRQAQGLGQNILTESDVVKQYGDQYSPQRSAITGRDVTATWASPDLTDWDQFVAKMQDKQISTKRVVAAIRAAGKAISDRLDPYLQEILYHGRAAKRVSTFANEELRPILEEMQMRGVTMQEIDDYLWARHASERNAQIAKVNPSMPDGGSGLTNAQAMAILAGQTVTVGTGATSRDITLPRAKMNAYSAVSARIDKVTNGTLDLLVKYGLEKQSTVDTWRNTYKSYAPLMRDMESDDNYSGAFNLGTGTGSGFNIRGSAAKRAMGSQRTVNDIFANIAMQRERAIVRGEKNRVSQAVYGLALTAPNPDFWIPINPDLNKRVGAAGMQKLVNELVQIGVNPLDAENIIKEPTQRYVDPSTGLVNERINPTLRSRDDVLATRIDGEERYVMFSNNERAQAMVRALKNLDAETLGFAMQNMAKATRYFASINTQYNPVFGLTNGLRDMGTGMLNLSSTDLRGEQAAVARDAFSALVGIYIDLRDHRKGVTPTSKWAQLFEEFSDEGGQTGYLDMFQTSKARAEDIAKELKNAGKGQRWFALGEKHSHIFGWLSDFNTSIENAVRLSAYKNARDKGMTKQQAAALAKNLTVNFNKKGTAATQVGALYAFFNASVQGTARISETLLDGDYKLSAAGKKIVYGGIILGVMQAVLAAVAGWDDTEPPQFMRERNFIIPLPGGNYVSVPYPLGFHILPNLGRIPAEFALSGFKNPGERLASILSTIVGGMSPIGNGDVLQTITPTVVDPIAALTTNKDWTGKRIYKEDFNPNHPTPGWTRTKDTASGFSKFVSRAVNYVTGGGAYERGLLSPTPDQIDYLIGQATGGVGRESLKVWQTVSSAATGEEMPIYKVPVVGRFVGSTTGQASEQSRFYENLRRIGEHKSTMDEMRDAKDGEALRAYLDSHPDAKLVAVADKANREVAYLRRQKRDAIESGAGRDRVKLLEQRITALIRRYNEVLREKQ